MIIKYILPGGTPPPRSGGTSPGVVAQAQKTRFKLKASFSWLG